MKVSASGPGSHQDLGPAILEAIEGIRYGSVEIIIHDSRIVQIERKEKLRVETLLRTS